MNIWILSNTPLDPQADLTAFLPLAEPRDVRVFDTEAEIKQAIETSLFIGQKHIDLVIIYWKDTAYEFDLFPHEEYDESFIDWIRASDQVYSARNFNFKSIPVIVFNKELSHKSMPVQSFRNTKYDSICYPGGFYESDHFIDTIGKPIYYWIKRIGDELDRLNVDLSFNFSKLRASQIDSLGSEILSDSFLQRRQSLDYLWIGEKLRAIDSNVSLLSKAVKTALSDKRKREEKKNSLASKSKSLFAQRGKLSDHSI